VVITDTCMGVSQLLGACDRAAPKVYAYVLLCPIHITCDSIPSVSFNLNLIILDAIVSLHILLPSVIVVKNQRCHECTHNLPGTPVPPEAPSPPTEPGWPVAPGGPGFPGNPGRPAMPVPP